MRRILMRAAARLVVLVSLARTGAPAVAQQTAAKSVSGFHIVLLMASNKPGGPGSAQPEGLTPAMIKALRDLETLLPFKR